RRLLAQERTDDEHAIERAERGDRHAEPGDALARAVGREGGASPAKSVGTELRGEVELLERGVRRCQDAEILQPRNDEIKCLLPVELAPGAVSLHHRPLQA